MAEQHRRYSFPPLERRGVLLGLHTGQLGTLLFGVAGALFVNRSAPAPFGAGLAFLVLAGSVGIALWPRSGRPLVSWLPVAIAWAWRSASGCTVTSQPLAGHGPRASSGRPARVTGPPGIEVLEADGGPGDEPLGLVRDRRSGTWAAVVPVRGRSFVLLDGDAQVGQLEAWRAVLGTLARPNTPLRRLQWLHCSAPVASDRGGDRGDGRPLSPAAAQALPVPAHRGWALARESYRQLVAHEGLVTQTHSAWLVLAIGSTPRPGRPSARSLHELRREVRLLRGQLRNADLQAGPPLDLRDLRALVGAAYPPDGIPGRSRDRVGRWPMATDEAWSAYRVDGAWHATFWIAEWPRVEVNPDFLTPLLLCDGRRTMSVVMAPVAASQAAREVRAARAADAADEELRSRAGFLPSMRRRREAEGVIRREAELADGHADYRFSGYVTVTAADRDGLEAACVETEQAAQRAHLELRRLYGRQAEAFTWTLPLARGLS
jgi:hypothetical protein